MSPVEQLRAGLADLPDVTQSASHFGARGNPAWSIAGREFAHLHADDVLDLRLPPALQSGLRAEPKARFRKGRSEWLELEFHTVEDVARLAALARVAHAAVREAKKD